MLTTPAAQHPTAHPPRTSKRRLSDAGHPSHDQHYDHDDGHDDQDGLPMRSKRTRPHALGAAAEIGAAGVASTSSSSSSSATMAQTGTGVPQRALSEKEKEQRRVARMIRNRNAAQASRDRKKEHTAFLENRVAVLETLLRTNGVKVPSTFAVAAPSPIFASSLSSSSSSSSSSSKALHRSQRALSVLSDDQGRIADLEDENDGLRSQLHLEQCESAQLRARLDEAEEQLAHLAHLSALSPDAPFSPFSGTTTPLPVGFEPTFAFDTPNLTDLDGDDDPETDDERRPPLGATANDDDDDDNDRHPGRRTDTDDGQLSPRSTRGGPFPAAEAVPESVSYAHPSPATSISSSSSSSSSSSYAASLADIASTPPATESYLELDDRVTVSPVWSDWARLKGGAPLPPLPPLDGHKAHDGDAVMKPLMSHDGAEESALAFLDLSFLQDGPVTTPS